MATVGVFSVPADALPLGKLFERVPDVTVELERVVPTEQGVVPYFWVHGDTDEATVEALESDPRLADLTVVDHVGDVLLLRVEWAPNGPSILDAIHESAVTLLSATGTADEWQFEIRGDTRQAVGAFRRACVDGGIPLEVERLHGAIQLDADHDERLTDKQREAIQTAYERGYFDSPRRATLDDVAAELGISRQAVASRLRRGLRHLIGASLDVPGDD